MHTLSRILSLTTMEPSFPHNFFMLRLWCPYYTIYVLHTLHTYMYCTRTEVPNLTLSSWTLARVTLLSREIERERKKKVDLGQHYGCNHEFVHENFGNNSHHPWKFYSTPWEYFPLLTYQTV